MQLKHPKLLRRQYLIRSPIWRTYIANPANHKIPEQLFKINTKLYCAYTISEVLRATTNTTMLIEKFNRYCQDQRYGDDYENLEKVRAFLGIVQLRNSDRNQYLQKLAHIYDLILEKYGQQQRKNYEEQVQAYIRKTRKQPPPPPSINFTPSTLYQKYLHRILTISNANALEDIDLLILTTTSPSITHMHVLGKIQQEWAQKDLNYVLAVNIFKDLVVRNLSGGNWDDIGLLMTFLPKFRETLVSQRKKIAEEGKEDHNQSIDVEYLFLEALDNLIVERKEPTITVLKLLNKPLAPVYNKSRFNTYLECFLNQYLILLQWLSIKCLYQPSKQNFISTLKQFLQCSDLVNLSEIIKNTQEQELKIVLKHHRIKIQLCKLEITSNLFDEITSNLRKLADLQKNINDLRTIVLNLQKECERLCKQAPKNKTKNQLQDCVGNMKRIECVINLSNCNINSSPDCVNQFLDLQSVRMRRTINNDTIRKLSQQYIEMIVNYDVILLNKQDIGPVYRVIEDLALRKGNLNHKINQYQKKLVKHLDKKCESKLPEEQNKTLGSRIGTLSEAKYLWELLTDKQKNLKNNQATELEDVRNSIFILQNNSSTILHGNNMLFNKICQFFNAAITKEQKDQNQQDY